MILKKTFTNLWTIQILVAIAEITLIIASLFLYLKEIEMKEITYINRYYNIFDSKISEFVTADLLKADIEEKYNN